MGIEVREEGGRDIVEIEGGGWTVELGIVIVLYPLHRTSAGSSCRNGNWGLQ